MKNWKEGLACIKPALRSSLQSLTASKCINDKHHITTQKINKPYKAHQQNPHTWQIQKKKPNGQPYLFHILCIIIIVHHLQCFKATTLTTSLLNDERQRW